MGPDRNAPASLRAPLRPAHGPVAGQAAFTPRRPPAAVAAPGGASIEELVQAMSKRLEHTVRFRAVRTSFAACVRAASV